MIHALRVGAASLGRRSGRGSRRPAERDVGRKAAPCGEKPNRACAARIIMSDWSPKTLWDRVRQALEGDADSEVDEASMMSMLLFAAPMFLAFVILVRR